MGNFDFGAFQQIFDYVLQKIQAGGTLSPEEQQVYDLLLTFANQGLDLTKTSDFNSLYTAFNALADDATKAQFAKLYGTNLFQDPTSGAISFTQPGTLVTQLMKQGLSINDGPVMALLAQGLQDYTKQIAQNKFASMTNAYSAMTPIRAQNIQAATNAGQIGTAGANRLVQLAGPGVSGGAAAGSGGDPITIDTSGGGSGSSSTDWLKYLLPGLLGLGGTLLVGGLGQGWLANLLKKNPNDPTSGDSGPLLGAQPLTQQDLIDRGLISGTPSSSFGQQINPTLYGFDPTVSPSALMNWSQNPPYDPSVSSYNQNLTPSVSYAPSSYSSSSSYYDPSAYNSYSYYDPTMSYSAPSSTYDFSNVMQGGSYWDPSYFSGNYSPPDTSYSYSYDPYGYSY